MYRLQPLTTGTRSKPQIDRTLTKARLQLNRNGVYAAADSSQSKLLVFVGSRAELEALLKPFHRLSGAKITLACAEDIVFDFADQRDVSIREVATAAQAARRGFSDTAQMASQWAKFRSTIVSAIQDFVMCTLCDSQHCIQLSRHQALLLCPGASNGELWRESLAAGAEAALALTIHVDFVTSGRVFANKKVALLPNILPLDLTIGPQSRRGRMTSVVLLPTSLRGFLVPDLEDMLGSAEASSDTRSHVGHIRRFIADWLDDKSLPCPSIENSAEWVSVSVNSKKHNEKCNDALELSHKTTLPWPRRYLMQERRVCAPPTSSIVEAFFSDEEDLFHLALKYKTQKHDGVAVGKQDDAVVYPPISPDSCHDLAEEVTSPPDTVMRDAAADVQQAGVYPTPSDGAASHQTPASVAYDSPYIPSSQSQEQQAIVGTTQTTDLTTAHLSNSLSVPLSKRDHLRGRGRSPGLPGMADDDFDFFDETQDEHIRPAYVSSKVSETNKSLEEESNGLFDDDDDDDDDVDAVRRLSPAKFEQDSVPSPSDGHESPRVEGTSDKAFTQAMKTATGRTTAGPSEKPLSSLQTLSLKYAANGTFSGSHKALGQALSKDVSTMPPKVPRLGIPSNGSESQSSESSENYGTENAVEAVHTADYLDQNDVESPPGGRGNDMTDLLSQDDEITIGEIEKLVDASDISPRPIGAELSRSNNSQHWDHFRSSSLKGFSDEECISIIQHLTTCLVAHFCYSHGMDPPTLSAEENGIIHPKAVEMDLLALALNSTASTPFVDTADLSPTSKRQDQEARVQLRKSVLQIEPPRVRVNRHDVAHSMLSTAMHFSESLGIGPASGAKNVTAFCISPLQHDSSQAVRRFHDTMEDAYTSRLMGCYARGSVDGAEDTNSGHAAVRGLDKTSSIEDITRAYRETCSALGAYLADHDFTHSAVFLFMVDITGNDESLVSLSACYHELLKGFRSACVACSPKISMHDACHGSFGYVVIPSSFVDVDITKSVSLLRSNTRHLLASTIYNHVMQETARSGPFQSMTDVNPVVELDTDVLAEIPFELTSSLPRFLFLQDMPLHVAYAFDSHRNWLVVSWCDRTGKYQAHRTYPLKHLSLPIIFEEVWQSTLSILDSDTGRQLRWRIYLVKAQALLTEEAKTWADVIGDMPRNVSVWLYTVETMPRFSVSIKKLEQFTVSESAKPSPAPALSSPSASTPGFTPDGLSTEGDANARLVDITDQTWGLILSFQPNTADTPLLFLPSLQSALLMKRQTDRDCDPPVVMQLNLMKVLLGQDQLDRGVAEHITTTKAVLRMYASLATLARLGGVEPRNSIKPIHIAFVERALHGLEEIIEV